MSSEFPLLKKENINGLQIKACERNKKLIEKLIREDDRCPAEVILFNFSRKPVNGKTAARACCDIYIKKYLSDEKGKFSEGEIIEGKTVHSIISKGKIHGHPLTFLGNKKNHSKNRSSRYRLNKINELCVENELPYRAYSIKPTNTEKKIIFWSPEYGYGIAGLYNWVKSPTQVDPFRQIKIDNKKKNELKIFLFDIKLSDRFEVLDDSIQYDNTGIKLIPIFCKEHGNKIYSRVSNIKEQLTFNCPGCATGDDFFNVKRIKHIRLHPDDDEGKTIVALIVLLISGKRTLKFGIAKHKKIDSKVSDSLHRRYGSKIQEILCYRKCNTELEARELEQNMLNKTLDFRDRKVPKDFGGYTECRIYGKAQIQLCKNAFLFTEYEYDN